MQTRSNLNSIRHPFETVVPGSFYLCTLNPKTQFANMKKMTTTLMMAVFGLFLFSCGGDSTSETKSTEVKTGDAIDASGTYNLDAGESSLNWTGHMLKVGGVSLYNHHGTLDFEKGRVEMANGQIVEGTFVVDMTSITPTDNNFTPEEGRTKEKLIGHLTSGDFFAVENYPTATLEITGMEGGKVMGDMTIRGKTNPVIINGFEMDTDGDMMRTKGILTLDRQKFDVAFKMGVQDKVLSDDVDLEFNVVFNKSNLGI